MFWTYHLLTPQTYLTAPSQCPNPQIVNLCYICNSAAEHTVLAGGVSIIPKSVSVCQCVCLILRPSWSLISLVRSTAPSTPACCPLSAPAPGSLR